jgi:hypothetical protein
MASLTVLTRFDSLGLGLPGGPGATPGGGPANGGKRKRSEAEMLLTDLASPLLGFNKPSLDRSMVRTNTYQKSF